jgi:alpha-1,3-rhamnosyl/mannosyltransferase
LHGLWTYTGRPRVERLIGPVDVVHAVSPSVPLPTAKPFVLTVHDVFPHLHPEWYDSRARRMFRAAMARAVDQSAQVIVPSAATARDLADAYPDFAGRVTVLPWGATPHLSPGDGAAQRAASDAAGVKPGTYLVALGEINVRKNLPLLFDVVAALPPPTTLVVVGADGVGAEAIRAAATAHPASTRIRFAGRLPDAEVGPLLAGALALVQPELDAGFGLPVVEAMALGVPVVVARSGALPEVVGEAGVVIDVDDPTVWAGALQRLREDQDLAARLRQAGVARAATMTWADNARGTLGVYRRALGQ